ncbi:sodium-dependent transporter [Thalassolituus oleivorans]|uniref:Transporter n=1 Tax=Thalassolituus oleivorans MIL-1 TaxID=1298593 RepID=M5DV68_9GAMM|nr:sodium-dependent transporter [Thalassolituus oleivorans]CCU73143.1 NSS family transporter [Thalassolituus oleivorans MIL-1]
MTADKRGMHGIWSSRWTFILAATGSAVGLGNIWKFPYIAGENGGGAFVLVYLLCILTAGIPIMMAEVLLGRKARMSPIHTMERLTATAKAPRMFAGIGWMGAVAGFCILSFYSVIAGWTVYYTVKMATGTFTGISGENAGAVFSDLLADPQSLMLYHTIFMVLVGVVIARGVHRGLENAVRIMMPLLFIMLILLLGYSLTTPGFSQGFNFLFSFDFSKLSQESVVVALGHAFFTLSLGMGAIMAYGAYMPADASLGKTVLAVGILDTIVALAAGLVIFPIVFTNGLEPGAGPGLMFQTLPIAFGGLPGGVLIGTTFFVLVVIAAWSSAISIAEPAVAWCVEKGVGRGRSTFIVCALAWFLGIGTVFSFNDWSNNQFFVHVTPTVAEQADATSVQLPEAEWFAYADVSELERLYPPTESVNFQITGKTFFDVLDFLTANILLPLGGVLISLFGGWFLSRRSVADEARVNNTAIFEIWRFMIRFVSPAAVLFVFIHGIL